MKQFAGNREKLRFNLYFILFDWEKCQSTNRAKFYRLNLCQRVLQKRIKKEQFASESKCLSVSVRIYWVKSDWKFRAEM